MSRVATKSAVEIPTPASVYEARKLRQRHEDLKQKLLVAIRTAMLDGQDSVVVENPGFGLIEIQAATEEIIPLVRGRGWVTGHGYRGDMVDINWTMHPRAPK